MPESVRFEPNAPVRPWDVSPEGRSNSSAQFCEIRAFIARLIRGEAYNLIAGQTEAVAQLILAQLAHGDYKMAPTGATPAADLVVIVEYGTVDGQGLTKVEVEGYRTVLSRPLIGNREYFKLVQISEATRA